MKLLRHLTANEEKLESFPFRRELSMESYLVENEDVLALDNDTFSDAVIIQEELTLKQGRLSKNTDGRIDILLTYSNEYIGVNEMDGTQVNNYSQTSVDSYNNKVHSHTEMINYFNNNCAGKQSESAYKAAQKLNQDAKKAIK